MYFYVMEFLEVIFIWYRVILFKRWEEEKSIKQKKLELYMLCRLFWHDQSLNTRKLAQSGNDMKFVILECFAP